MFLVTFFNHLALNIFSTLFQCWNNNCHYFNHISTLKIGHVPAGFQLFSIKRCINVVSTLKQQLTLFQPYFNVEGRSCAGWVWFGLGVLLGFQELPLRGDMSDQSKFCFMFMFHVFYCHVLPFLKVFFFSICFFAWCVLFLLIYCFIASRCFLLGH